MLTALVAGVTLLTACHPPATEAPDPSSTPAAGAPSAVRDQSTVFFPGAGDSYGVAVDQTDRDHLTELAALRKIDPCGFVAAENAGRADDGRAALGGRAYSYTYNAVSNLLVGGDRLHTLGGNACAVALSDSKIGLLLTVNPGDPQGYTGSTPLTPDPEHPGVTKTTSWGKCTYRVRLPLTAMAGAPPSMQDPMLQVTPMSDGTWELEDTSRCDLAGALAGDAAALVSNRGVPVFTDKASAAAWYLSSDPCAAAEDLSAQRFRWDDPPPRVAVADDLAAPGDLPAGPRHCRQRSRCPAGGDPARVGDLAAAGRRPGRTRYRATGGKDPALRDRPVQPEQRG